MSQSRFSIVLVGVSALLRRPLVSRLRPADGERSPWVVFAARVGRFDSGFRWASWPSGSQLPLFGMHRFGVAARRVGLRAHCFRFSARTASELPFGELVLLPSASELPFGGLALSPSASELPFGGLALSPSVSELPLGGLAFGLTASEIPLGGLALPPSASEIAAGRLAFGLTASAFGMHRFGVAARRIGLRAHRFRFSVCAASGLPLGGLAFGLTASEIPLGGLALPPSASEIAAGRLAFGLTASAFRHAPLRGCRWASWFFRLPFRSCRSAGWPSGSLLPLFGTRRFGVALGELVLPLSGLAFGLTASAFRYAPLRGCPRRAGSSTRRVGFSAFRFGNCPRRVGLRAHCFRFSARTASEIALGGLVLPPSVSEITAGRVGLRIHCFRFSACTDSGVPSAGWFFRLPFRRLPSAGWPSGSLLPLFGTHRFGGALGGLVLPLGGLAFGFTASAFRHAPLRKLPSAGWPSGSLLPLFGMRRSAPPHRRSEDRRSTPTRHLFHFKHLSQHVNLPHRTP